MRAMLRIYAYERTLTLLHLTKASIQTPALSLVVRYAGLQAIQDSCVAMAATVSSTGKLERFNNVKAGM